MNLKRKTEAARFTLHIWERYKRSLHAFLVRRMHRAHDKDVEDLLQEVWERLLKANNAEFIENPLAYAMTVGANVAKRFGERDKRIQEHVVVDSELTDSLLDASQNPASSDPVAERISTEQQLEVALAKLPSLFQSILIMFYRDEYTYEEIGERLNMSVYKVERLLADARDAIKEIDWEWD